MNREKVRCVYHQKVSQATEKNQTSKNPQPLNLTRFLTCCVIALYKCWWITKLIMAAHHPVRPARVIVVVIFFCIPVSVLAKCSAVNDIVNPFDVLWVWMLSQTCAISHNLSCKKDFYFNLVWFGGKKPSYSFWLVLMLRLLQGVVSNHCTS